MSEREKGRNVEQKNANRKTQPMLNGRKSNFCCLTNTHTRWEWIRVLSGRKTNKGHGRPDIVGEVRGQREGKGQHCRWQGTSPILGSQQATASAVAECQKRHNNKNGIANAVVRVCWCKQTHTRTRLKSVRVRRCHCRRRCRRRHRRHRGL